MLENEAYIDYAVTPESFPHPAAHAWGEDQFGWWMSIQLAGVEQKFRWIFPGTFQMGSPEKELQRRDNETQHWVELSQGYWLADTTCTQALWQAVMEDNPARFQDNPNNPVESVSWEDITDKFLPQLESITGLAMRLPTEAEWEYACRAETTTPFNLGKNITTDQVNFNGNHPYADGDKGQYRGNTVPVKSMNAPNAWGLHEMHGNVWEWCQDRFGSYGEQAQLDPQGSDTGLSRVARGGSWISDGEYARSAFRDFYTPVNRFNRIGFRLAFGKPASRQAEPRDAKLKKPRGQPT